VCVTDPCSFPRQERGRPATAHVLSACCMLQVACCTSYVACIAAFIAACCWFVACIQHGCMFCTLHIPGRSVTPLTSSTQQTVPRRTPRACGHQRGLPTPRAVPPGTCRLWAERLTSSGSYGTSRTSSDLEKEKPTADSCHVGEHAARHGPRAPVQHATHAVPAHHDTRSDYNVHPPTMQAMPRQRGMAAESHASLRPRRASAPAWAAWSLPATTPAQGGLVPS
jgi:hypothetical protein